jgi:hypothetical protein
MKSMNLYLKSLKKLNQWIMSRKVSAKIIFIIMGIASTIWFLFRVIPKPQRAGYPCMKAAAPIMSGFIIYILGLGGITLFFRKSITQFRRAKYLPAIFAFILSIVLLVAFNMKDAQKTYASTLAFTRGVLPDEPNSPMGIGRGIFPGRVVWDWNPAATNENCTNSISDAFFMASNNNQDTIDKMTDVSIRSLGGKSKVSEAWDAIFKNFNNRKTGSPTGYTTGQTIFIKVNNGQAGWAINMSTLAETGQTSGVFGTHNIAMSGTTPAAVVAIIRQLVDSCGIPQNKIYVGEPMTHVYKSMYDAVHAKYPNVKIIDKEDHTSLGRTTSTGWTANAIVYSDKGEEMPDAINDALMNEMYNADYMINVAALKAHARGGVTLNAKLHFGSHGNHPGQGYGSFHLHDGLICTVDNDVMTSGVRGNYHMYRVLVDLMGNKKLGENTVLFVVDGLWSGIEATDMPVKWKTAPFNNDFPSSLFFSQDEIALESVCIDFLRAEADINTAFKDRPFFPAVDDYLHQGADPANWPVGITYDPEGDGTPITSLGVHEHWNNSTAKQYSRDLFTNGTGIDLISFPSTLVNHVTEVAYNLTITVMFGGNPVQNATVKVNGLVYLTNAEGKAIIENLTSTSGLDYSIEKTGYKKITKQVAINDNTEVTEVLETFINAIDTKVLDNNFSIYPNPCINETKISYTLSINTSVSIYLVSMDGRVVKNVKDQQMIAGEYRDIINTSDLKTGLYICVIKTTTDKGSNIQNLKLEVK